MVYQICQALEGVVLISRYQLNSIWLRNHRKPLGSSFFLLRWNPAHHVFNACGVSNCGGLCTDEEEAACAWGVDDCALSIAMMCIEVASRIDYGTA